MASISVQLLVLAVVYISSVSRELSGCMWTLTAVLESDSGSGASTKLMLRLKYVTLS